MGKKSERIAELECLLATKSREDSTYRATMFEEKYRVAQNTIAQLQADYRQMRDRVVVENDIMDRLRADISSLDGVNADVRKTVSAREGEATADAVRRAMDELKATREDCVRAAQILGKGPDESLVAVAGRYVKTVSEIANRACEWESAAIGFATPYDLRQHLRTKGESVADQLLASVMETLGAKEDEGPLDAAVGMMRKLKSSQAVRDSVSAHLDAARDILCAASGESATDAAKRVMAELLEAKSLANFNGRKPMFGSQEAANVKFPKFTDAAGLMTPEQATMMMHDYFEKFPGVREYMDKMTLCNEKPPGNPFVSDERCVLPRQHKGRHTSRGDVTWDLEVEHVQVDPVLHESSRSPKPNNQCQSEYRVNSDNTVFCIHQNGHTGNHKSTGSNGTAYEWTITEEQAKSIISKWRKQWPSMAEYMKNLAAEPEHVAVVLHELQQALRKAEQQYESERAKRLELSAMNQTLGGRVTIAETKQWDTQKKLNELEAHVARILKMCEPEFSYDNGKHPESYIWGLAWAVDRAMTQLREMKGVK